MTEFETTDHGRKATKLVSQIADHIAEVFDVPRDKDNAVRPVPSEPEPGFAPYTEGGSMVVMDIPLSTFISDMSLTPACASLPESVRAAIESHMDNTYRHHLEVAVQGDADATAAIGDWDWSTGLPINELDAAGFEELTAEAYSNADLDFDAETLRIRIEAMDRHCFRDGILAIAVTANTEFEYHQTDGQLSANIGPREGRPRVDHNIVDVDFSEASDFSDAKFAALLDVIKQSFPEPEAPAPRFG